MAWPHRPDNRISPPPAEPTPTSADDDEADALARLLSDARVDEAVLQRRRERWLQRQAAEESTFAGLLENLAEIGEPISVRTAGGQRHRGIIAALGDDVVALSQSGGCITLVALERVTALDAGYRSGLNGRRDLDTERASLRHLLAELAEVMPDVVCTLDGGDVVPGRLRWVGEDVAVVMGSTGEGIEGARECYVRLSSLVTVSFSVSG